MSLSFVATPSNANLCSFGDCCFLHLQSLSDRSEWISWNFHQLQRTHIATFNTYKLNLFSCNFEKIYLGKWKSRNGPQPTVKKMWKPKAASHPVCQTPGTPVCCVISVSLKRHHLTSVKSGHRPITGLVHTQSREWTLSIGTGSKPNTSNKLFNFCTPLFNHL